MTGLLERIARRRRASAGSRLGPPSQNGSSSPNGSPYANGGAMADHRANGATAHAVAEPAPPAPKPQAPEPVEAQAPEPVEAQAPEPAEAQAPEPVEAQAPEPAGAQAPEPAEAPAPPPPALPTRPGFVERGRMRRRARYLRKLREVQIRDIGGFLLELHRFGRQRPDLVEAKIAGAVHTDRELRALEHALGEQQLLRELREPGLGGACHNCGAVHGSADRFCASCGEPLTPRMRSHDV
jgi:hypothetical protein